MVFYYAQNATIEARTEDGTKYEECGAAQEVSFEWNVEAAELHGFGTIKRLDAARHNLNINVTVKFAKFKEMPTDDSYVTPWFWKILSKGGFDRDWTAQDKKYYIKTNDTSSFTMFRISGQFRPTEGEENENYIYAVADNVYFKTFQWGGSLGEYVIENLEGTAKDITYTTKKPDDWLDV